MFMIRVTCGRCGEVKIPDQAITVWTHKQPNRNTYGYDCPACGLSHALAATPAIINYLATSKVRRIKVEVPDELLEKHTGPALTADYVLDLALQLADGDVDTTECEPVTVTLPAPGNAPRP